MEEQEGTTLQEMQKIVDSWIRTIGNGYFSPLTNTAILAEETGEAAAIMARTYGNQKSKPGDKDRLADELADILWVVAAIANQTDINLQQAFKDNLLKKNTRDKNRFN